MVVDADHSDTYDDGHVDVPALRATPLEAAALPLFRHLMDLSVSNIKLEDAMSGDVIFT